ncbi:hypothetical protein ACFQAS_02080 [Halopenitus salinus]|uniref:Uncharacterized protein n=1 Tax=Halopenitus salinus TaxID=1198295 RepID=A0ABD5UQY3_9EURY
MVEQLSANLMEAFIYGLIAASISGIIFESGDRYTKTAWSGDQFAGKIEALPFFLATFFLGLFIKYGEGVIGAEVSALTQSFIAGQRIGLILIFGMIAFNASVDNFRYTDLKSLMIMGIGGLLFLRPEMIYTVV